MLINRVNGIFQKYRWLEHSDDGGINLVLKGFKKKGFNLCLRVKTFVIIFVKTCLMIHRFGNI